MERGTRWRTIGPLLIAWLLGSVLFLVGTLTGGLAWLHTVPASTRIVFLGILLVLTFYPQFMIVSCCRTLLAAIREMEKRYE